MQYKEWDDANSELFKESHDEAVHKNSYKSRLYELISASLDRPHAKDRKAYQGGYPGKFNQWIRRLRLGPPIRMGAAQILNGREIKRKALLCAD